jgi:N-acetylglucosamine-6-sulfatase
VGSAGRLTTPGGVFRYCVAVAISLVVILASVPDAAAQASPNVVVVLTDDQRIGTMSRMPALWSLIRKKGVLFPNAMVPTSLCCPSRASILTGLYSHSTRIFSNGLPDGGWESFNSHGLEDRTIALTLQAAGYRTGFVGRYLNGGFPRRAATGYVPPGWDSFLTFTTQPAYFNYGLNDGSVHGGRPADYSTDVLRTHAVRFIRSTPSDEPLFLFFSTVGPHRPFTPAPRHVGAWTGRLPPYRPPSVTENVSDKPPWVSRYGRVAQWRIRRDLAFAQESLMSVDDAVRLLARALEDTGRIGNTLFVFMSDNGLLMGEHHLYTWKNVPYRLATSIPLVVRWDGRIRANSTDRRLALNVDVATTVAEAAGTPMATEGLSLLGPRKRGGFPLEGGMWYRWDSLPRHPAYCGYRTRRWMYAHYEGGETELYSYADDPHETQNLARLLRYSGQVAAMRAKAEAACSPVPPNFDWDVDE